MHVLKALAFTLILAGVIPVVIADVGSAMKANAFLGLVVYGGGLVTFALLWCGMLLDSIDQTLKKLHASRERVELPPAAEKEHGI